jgi:hypothetical protein
MTWLVDVEVLTLRSSGEQMEVSGYANFPERFLFFDLAETHTLELLRNVEQAWTHDHQLV